MSWPDPVEDCWPDDHTREAEELYQRVRREAQVPVPNPKPEWFQEGSTAEAFERFRAGKYLHPRGAPSRSTERRRPARGRDAA